MRRGLRCERGRLGFGHWPDRVGGWPFPATECTSSIGVLYVPKRTARSCGILPLRSNCIDKSESMGLSSADNVIQLAVSAGFVLLVKVSILRSSVRLTSYRLAGKTRPRLSKLKGISTETRSTAKAAVVKRAGVRTSIRKKERIIISSCSNNTQGHEKFPRRIGV
jgi:hypothetical protein